MDSAHIHESDIKFLNKRRQKNGQEPLKPLYTTRDAELCLKHFKPIPYDAEFNLNDEVSFHFTDVGHIIGSASVSVTVNENNKITRLAYTGDVGRYNDLLLKAPSTFSQADYIICESTYGDRLHEGDADAESKFLRIVLHTCVDKKGKLIIPAFSLGRTQEIVFVLNKLKNEGRLPNVKVYVDSPLSTHATEIVRRHPECFNDALQQYIKTDSNPFGFEGLTYVEEAVESKGLNNLKEPCIIISAAGMCDAGRIKHHLMNTISDPSTTVLIAGYCSPNTLGRRLMDGDKSVHIFGEYFEVKAEIETILSYSAHADYSELIRFLSCQNKKQVKNIFLVHGEDGAKIAFKKKLEEEGYPAVEIAEKGVTYKLI